MDNMVTDVTLRFMPCVRDPLPALPPHLLAVRRPLVDLPGPVDGLCLHRGGGRGRCGAVLLPQPAGGGGVAVAAAPQREGAGGGGWGTKAQRREQQSSTSSSISRRQVHSRRARLCLLARLACPPPSSARAVGLTTHPPPQRVPTGFGVTCVHTRWYARFAKPMTCDDAAPSRYPRQRVSTSGGFI